MPAVDRSAPALLRAVGLLPDGPGQWGRQSRAQGGGVFVVELPSPLASAPLDHGHIGRWLERVPALLLDGTRPTGRELLARLASFWLPSEAVLFVGSTTGSIAGRAAAMARTELGERKPAPSGNWLHALSDRTMLRIWWASTDAPEEYEDALLERVRGRRVRGRSGGPSRRHGGPAVGEPPHGHRGAQGHRDRKSARAGHLASPAATGQHDRRPAARRGRWSP